MKKILISFCCIMILISCGKSQYETVVILGKDAQSRAPLIQGMGVLIQDEYILTSAHVVGDDRLRYEINGTPYTVQRRDTGGDRAILRKVSNTKEGGMFPKGIGNTQKGDLIYTQVYRSGSIITLTGTVLDPSGYVTAYDTRGRVTTLSGVVLTDLTLFPGDSGAPLFNKGGEIVDVVHVR